MPCQNCAVRDEQASCKYRGTKNTPTPIAREQDNHEVSMQRRIQNLEDLVKRLIVQGHGQVNVANQHLNSSDVASIADTGSTVIDGVHSVYKVADDWHNVLEEINRLKQTWSQTQDDHTDHGPLSYTEADGASLLFGQVKQIERAEILATLPCKPEVDELISQFFDAVTFPLAVPPILHEPTFMREYNEHWRDPSQTNIIWLGLLFSILSTVMLSYHQWDEPPRYYGISESLFQLYRLRTAQCLIIGDIAKCLPYTIETLRFNATAELNRQDDNSRGLWIITGVIVRAAINMGYHRDPSQLSSLSVLQSEYRRRVWNAVTHMDDLASFLVGFPRMMAAIYSDTKEPRNIHDWELTEETTVLPSSRPLTEPTSVTYMIVKGHIAHALGRITDFNNLPGLGSYDTVLSLDKSLHEAYQNMPPHMRVFHLKGELKSSSSQSVITSMQLESLYHKGMCTLHQHGRRGPELSTPIEFDCAPLLQALEKSCALWSEAKKSCEEANGVCQILTGMLSSFQTPSTTQRRKSPDLPLEIPGFSPLFQSTDRRGSMKKDIFRNLNDEIDIDWATWDAFIDEANFEDGF
ncbi:hypothetical protein UA08_01376 [Talaromyces atroroseus]|uniref:Xylanolytic transcriptional activator regulatory domain-containing protein n=1 Tax=Talaromyces atroroseus TaxID=1441469 RepID=A0A1Q5QB47_TALAT|nr:hypothetical protein UA08_01376 [Talaromyces atroroseus]OKL63177.1 hypothetical protein UA08_01376 [Talaromyces atroroseus]